MNALQKKKKKKKTIYLISGIIIVAVIGTITYLAWPKNNPVENQKPTNSKTEIQKLQIQLNSLKSKLDNISDATQKTQLENKLSNVENQIKNLSSQNNLPATIKNLEQEIKQAIEGKDNPDEDPGPTDKKEGRFKYGGDALKRSGYIKFEGGK